MLSIYDYFDSLSQVNGISFGLDIILRTILAILAGMVVGYERKRRQKEAGIRTHCMVALGACVFAVVSKYGFYDTVLVDSVQVDASRVAANVVTGVCFLGAGMIFVRSKSISGLTTAAGIWAVSAIGLAFGVGLYSIAIFATCCIVFIQYILHKPLIKLEGSPSKEVTCTLECFENFEDFSGVIMMFDPQAIFTSIEKRADGTVVTKFVIHNEQAEIIRDSYSFMKKYAYVRSVTV